MKREELIAMGISEENVEKIIADYGSAVQREQAKAAELKAKADSADELQKKLDEMEAGNLTELEKANNGSSLKLNIPAKIFPGIILIA